MSLPSFPSNRPRTFLRLARWTSIVFLLIAAPAIAHIGSPDTFVQSIAGPYTLLVSVHPPSVTPGALELDLSANPDDHLTTASASLDDTAPTPIRVLIDGTATTSLWVATPSAKILHITVQGSRGPGSLTLTLPASPNLVATTVARPWLRPLALAIVLLMAAALLRRRRFYASVCLYAAAALGLLAILTAHSATHTTLDATLSADGQLDLALTSPNESLDDLLPDHGHILHLFLVREPQQDVLLHLHPKPLGSGQFTTQLPAMPQGTYTLFADFYHADRRNETATLTVTLPSQQRAVRFNPDDTSAVLPPLSKPAPPPTHVAGKQGVPDFNCLQYTEHLPDGYTLQLLTPATIHPLQADLLVATLLDPTGQPPADMALYLGMSAHAVVLRSDNGVFAHIHPGGTLPMLMPALPDGTMPGMVMPAPSNTATIPYGFPTPGRYRIFVQMRHGTITETGAFDLSVE